MFPADLYLSINQISKLFKINYNTSDFLLTILIKIVKYYRNQLFSIILVNFTFLEIKKLKYWVKEFLKQGPLFPLNKIFIEIGYAK